MAAALVVSHRTNAGDQPENTLAGIAAAIRDRADGVEVDVRVTRDGALVLMHDETLLRVTGDPRRIADVTLDELRALRVRDPRGVQPFQPVPTLAEAIAAVDGRCAIVIDCKLRGLEERVAATVRAADAQAWTWFTPDHAEDAALLARECPRSRVLLSTWGADVGEAIEVAAGLGLAGVNADHEAVSAAHVERAHALGLLLGVWTVNSPGEIARALDLRVEIVMTDLPRRAINAILAREPR
ncbi:MAG: glycerophosphodiester phosphodiesterase family protein [Dehalococcoidia bacterium]|nr:glycerophosphodiester phosphodiesterase family protein [Dehalococcoidia bacterium]